MTRAVTPADVKTYRDEGAVRLRGVIDAQWLDMLADGVERARASPGSYAKEYAKPGRGSFFTDHRMFSRLEPFRRFLFAGPAPGLAAQILGAERLNLYDEHLLIKEPGTDAPTNWHQDLPFWNVQGDQTCSIWLSLDRVTEDTGALRFVIGSHRWGKLYTPVDIGAANPAQSIEDGELAGPVPDVDSDPSRYATVCYPVEPGDCVVFHARTLHSARGNSSTSVRRRALSLRFCGEDTRWKNRRLAAKLFATPLQDGAALDREECPRVWPRPK